MKKTYSVMGVVLVIVAEEDSAEKRWGRENWMKGDRFLMQMEAITRDWDVKLAIIIFRTRGCRMMGGRMNGVEAR